jgi:hypothetical protein
VQLRKKTDDRRLIQISFQKKRLNFNPDQCQSLAENFRTIKSHAASVSAEVLFPLLPGIPPKQPAEKPFIGSRTGEIHQLYG